MLSNTTIQPAAKLARYYGEAPEVIGKFAVPVKEMMFYQDMLIQMPYSDIQRLEERLFVFKELIHVCVSDYELTFGINRLMDQHIYISAKNLYQPFGQSYNRPGWHCDGFMSDDINYIWSNKQPTVFNLSHFNLTQDHKKSLSEMLSQAAPDRDITYANNSLIRIDQFNIHRVGDVTESGMRAFFKLTFSKRRFNLEGNTRNYMIDYDWIMIPRSSERNDPANAGSI